ncbi:MAG: phage portal protein [Planctomycetaceae bacterium]
MIGGLKRAWQAMSRPPAEDRSWRGWNVMRRIQAAYDAALPRDDLWQLADYKDADAALRPDVRLKIRSRARYEYANNSIVARVVDVWVGDVVGACGPKLQVHSGNSQVDQFVEQSWARWWRRSNQAATLRAACKADAVDGEAVGVLISNDRLWLARQPVTVDVLGVECDRLASPRFEDANRSDYVDGVHLDPATRQPVAYDILKAHPGTEYLDAVTDVYSAETFPRREVLHAFRRLRPEQHRGVCRYAPVLPVAGLHRKYLEAEVSRNQLRAAFAFVMKTMASPDDGCDGTVPEDKWWSEINLPNRSGAGLMLPEGYDVTQLRPDGTAAELDAFHRVIGGLVAGCFTMPVGRALGVYGSAGYAGIRAEMMPYHKAIASDRTQIWEPLWIDPLYEAFLFDLIRSAEWKLLIESLPPTARSEIDLDLHEWRWPERELVVDPSREENARKTRMSLGLTTRETETDTADIDEHDTRAAKLLGIDDVQQYRRTIAQSIHGAPPAAAAGAAPQQGQSGATASNLPENITTDKPLNGAQITSAIEIVQSLANETLSIVVARELLTALGFDGDRVDRMVASADEVKPLPAASPPAAPSPNGDGRALDAGGNAKDPVPSAHPPR